MPNQVIILLTEKGQAIGSTELYENEALPRLIKHNEVYFEQSRGSEYLYYEVQPIDLDDISYEYRGFRGITPFEGEEGADGQPPESNANSVSSEDKADPYKHVKTAYWRKTIPMPEWFSETITYAPSKPKKKPGLWKRMFSSL